MTVDFYDYFDKPAAQTNVIPINGTRRETDAGIHPYAAAIRGAWLDRLRALASRPWVQGDAWDQNCFVSARKLVELANSPWSGYDLADARNDYMAAAPHDKVWDKREKCWTRAEAKTGGFALPEPEPTWAIPDATVLAEQVRSAVDADDGTEDVVATWAPLDLEDVLDGTYAPELPTLMPRIDGQCLLYAGRVHSFHGESESGKSMVAQAEAAAILDAGGRVLYVDFESDRAAVVGRLLELGATVSQIRDGFTYVHPEVDPRRFPHEREALAELVATSYDLAVIDGVTDALGVFGASTKDNDEITTWIRILPRAIATATGAAVILIDHVTKDSESRGRFAIGGQAKMAALDGAAYVVEVTEALGRGKRGMITLRVAKDRPGGVRAHAGPFRPTDRTQEAARIVIDSTASDITVTVGNPSSDEPGEFRPTHLMERVSRYVELNPEATGRNITDDIGGRAQHVRKALEVLIHEGHVRTQDGPRNSHLHISVAPYREASDARSSASATVLEEAKDPVRPSASDRVPDALNVTASQPLRSRAGRDAVTHAGTQSSASRPETEQLAGCKRCFAPTEAGLLAVNQQLCIDCAHETGIAP